MQLVVIDGWWASGKGGVLYLLDGHPEVLVNPFQEGIFGAIATLRGDDAIRHPIELRNRGHAPCFWRAFATMEPHAR